MDELVDIINEDDQVIGRELKSKCHEEKILHRGGAVLCFKDETLNEVLVTTRSANKSYPDKLCFPGGHIHSGESYEDGAVREFVEEVLKDQAVKFKPVTLFKVIKKESLDPEIDMFFKTVYPGPFFIDEDEVAECYFEKIENLFEKSKKTPEVFVDSALLAINEYEKYLERENV
jgi:8-oxo-dGTP pyrophosphatase MutT (NUDIX family)